MTFCVTFFKTFPRGWRCWFSRFRVYLELKMDRGEPHDTSKQWNGMCQWFETMSRSVVPSSGHHWEQQCLRSEAAFPWFDVLLQNRYLVFIVKANKYKCCSSLCYLNKWIFTSDIASYSYSSFLMVVSNCSVFESWETSTTHYRMNCFINFTGEVCPVVFIEKK